MSSKFVFQAIGTHWQIDVFDDLQKNKEEYLLKKIHLRISDFEKVYSRFLEDSTVGRIAISSGEYIFPEDSQRLFSEYRKMYQITGGLFTPLIGKVLVDAGYDKEYSLKQKIKLKKPPSWDSVLDFDFPKLSVKEPVQLDFGAAGKGYLIDLVGKVLEENGVAYYCVDAGGDILYRNTQNQSMPVGLENMRATCNNMRLIGDKRLNSCGFAAIFCTEL